MSKLPIYLYPKVTEVLFDDEQTGGINRVMYQRKITVQKGFKDTVQIQFKNSDQKPIFLSSATNYWIDLISADGRELVLTKQLTVLDDTVIRQVSQVQTATTGVLYFTNTNGIQVGQTVTGFGVQANTLVVNASTNTVALSSPTSYVVTSATNVTFNTFDLRGVASVTFLPTDTINLTATGYKFVVKKDNGDGTFSPTYANTYYGVVGELDIEDSGFPIGFPVQTVTSEQLITGVEYNNDINNMGYVFFSGWLKPFPHAITTSTPQVATFALDNFAGTVSVQGTLDNNPSSAGLGNAQAFTITSYTCYTATIGNTQLSWNIALTGVRFTVQPLGDGFGVNYYPTGNPPGSQTNKFPNGFLDRIQFFS